MQKSDFNITLVLINKIDFDLRIMTGSELAIRVLVLPLLNIFHPEILDR
jgi:hypothetical protein